MTTPSQATHARPLGQVDDQRPHRPSALMTRVGTAAALWLLPVAASVLSGCIGYVRGNGDSASEERSVSSFSRLATEGPVDAELLVGEPMDHGTVTVICDSNLLEYIRTDVIDGELVVDTRPGLGINPRSTCVVKASADMVSGVESTGSGDVEVLGIARDLTSMRTTGSGEIDVDVIQSKRLELRTTGSGGISVESAEVDHIEASCSGSGGMELAGTVDYLELKTSGSGDIYARQLLANTLQAKSSGSGDIEANASVESDARTSGSGDVEVWGAPGKRSQNSTGSGDVIYR